MEFDTLTDMECIVHSIITDFPALRNTGFRLFRPVRIHIDERIKDLVEDIYFSRRRVICEMQGVDICIHSDHKIRSCCKR